MAFRESTYWWVKHGSKTGQHTHLQTVDKWVCKWFDEPVNPSHYSSMYLTAIDFAHAALMKHGGGHTEQRHVDWMLERIKSNSKMTQKEKAIYTGFFTDLFDMWQMHATG